MRHSSRHWPRLRDASALLLAGALAFGCVTRGTHDEVVAERDQLSLRVERLERSTASLDSERVKLVNDLEDLRQQQEQLDRDVRKLRKTEAQLASDLAARDVELASRGEELERLQGTYQGLVSDLEEELAAGEIEIQQLREGLQLNMAQDILFASGSTRVNPTGQSVLRKVAERVRKVPYLVVVQGHTDNVPIRSERYPTNWELAGARASQVVRLLAETGVDPGRLSAVSFGEFRPRDGNDSSQGRARNRRIEITLKPIEGEPVAASLEGLSEGQPPAAAAP